MLQPCFALFLLLAYFFRLGASAGTVLSGWGRGGGRGRRAGLERSKLREEGQVKGVLREMFGTRLGLLTNGCLD